MKKRGQNRVRTEGRGAMGKDNPPHLLIAVKPPMRKPSEMSSSGFVILNRTTESKKTTCGVKWVSCDLRKYCEHSQCVDSQHGDNEPIVSCRRKTIDESSRIRGMKEDGRRKRPSTREVAGIVRYALFRRFSKSVNLPAIDDKKSTVPIPPG